MDLTAIVAGGIASVIVGIIVFHVLAVVACWCIFSKAGQSGWKSLIPLYNVYILYKIGWKTSLFWLAVLFAIVGSCMMTFDPGVTSSYDYANAHVVVADRSIIFYIGLILQVVVYLMNTLCNYFVGRSFGHGLPFFILSLFLPNVVLLYLGFSRDRYLGNTTK